MDMANQIDLEDNDDVRTRPECLTICAGMGSVHEIMMLRANKANKSV